MRNFIEHNTESAEGCAVQTEVVLRQSLAEGVKLSLLGDKMDSCRFELQMELLDMYGRTVASLRPSGT